MEKTNSDKQEDSSDLEAGGVLDKVDEVTECVEFALEKLNELKEFLNSKLK